MVTGNVTAGANVNGTNASLVVSIPNGLYSGGNKTATAADTALVTGNIKSGATIFGVAGKTEVVDTTEAANPAVAARMKTGDVAFVNGAKITGNGTQTLSAANDTVSAGYYAATTLSAVDADLISANIKSGVTIFGKAGTYPFAAPSKTGQTTVYQVGDDGTYQKGVANPSPRFTDNGNGTVADNLTGIMWLQNANNFGARLWSQAISDCEGLSYAGYDDWRFPNIKELYTLIDVNNDTPALPTGHPFLNVQASAYWSSSTYAGNAGNAWCAGPYGGGLAGYAKISTMCGVWPVRGGQ